MGGLGRLGPCVTGLGSLGPCVTGLGSLGPCVTGLGSLGPVSWAVLSADWMTGRLLDAAIARLG